MSDDGPTEDSFASTTFQGLTPYGAPCLLEMLVMGFGLCNAPTTFTRFVTHVLDPFKHLIVIVYLDDICVYSKSAEEHFDRLRKILTAFYEKIHYLLKCSSIFGLNEKPSILVSLMEVAMFKHPNKRL
jgi:hypothetical protein